MSRRRPPVLLREAVAAIGECGHAVDVDTHSAHYKITWQTHDGHRLLFVVSRTPSDRRSAANSRAVLRRLLAQEERST